MAEYGRSSGDLLKADDQRAAKPKASLRKGRRTTGTVARLVCALLTVDAVTKAPSVQEHWGRSRPLGG